MLHSWYVIIEILHDFLAKEEDVTRKDAIEAWFSHSVQLAMDIGSFAFLIRMIEGEMSSSLLNKLLYVVFAVRLVELSIVA